MRILTSEVKKHDNMLLFVNQLRENIGVTYGRRTTTSGGRALRYYASGRLEVLPSSLIKINKEVIGRYIEVKILKSKTSRPYISAEFPIIFGQGIDSQRELATIAMSFGVARKKGSWISYGGDKWQGTDAFAESIREDSELEQELLKEVREELSGD